MTPKEKAKELYLKYCPYDISYCDPMGGEIEGYYELHAIRCAITTVDEIIKALYEYDNNTESYIKETYGKDFFSCECQNMDSDQRYWSKVKSEIEKIK